MNNKYDIAVIGGGHNGLTLASMLAKKGKKVIVLEKRPVMGGIAAGEEFHPGYKTVGLLHETSGLRSQVVKTLELEKHGLQLLPSQHGYSILSRDGQILHVDPDINKTSQAIAAFSEKDAEAYKEYNIFIEKIRGLISSLFNETPPDLFNLGAVEAFQLMKKGIALKLLGKKTMLELLKVAPMSVADFLNEKFATDFIKAGLAGPAIYGSFTGPWSSYTTLNLLMHECTTGKAVKGGGQAVIDALLKCSEANGVTLMTEAAVSQIMVDHNQKVSGVKLHTGEEIVANAVASSCPPQHTFFDLFEPKDLNYSLEQNIGHYRSRGTTAKVNLAINSSIKLNDVDQIAFARTGNSFDEMEKAFDAVKYGEFSNEPILDIHIPSVNDESLAPQGHSVVSILVHFAPHALKEGWNEEQKGQLYQTVLKTLEIYSPGISQSVVGSEVLSPVDLEDRYGLTNGHIYHGEHAIDQLFTRPIPACAQYKTPFEGLFLCGSGSHPGGGITGMPGYLGAKSILKYAKG